MEKWKTIIAMIGLVAIGFAGGFFTHRSMAKSHFERVARTGTPMGFQERLLDEVLKVDDAQRANLEPIVKEFGRKMGELHKGIRVERGALMDSLCTVISQDLREDQKERLQKFAKRQKRMKERKRPPNGKKRKERMSKENKN